MTRSLKNMSNTPLNSPSERIKILVVGDWLVDEYWLLGEQRSSFSRRRGLRHTLALHSAEASIRTLGGAGMVASILAQTKYCTGKDPAPDRVFEIHGLGRWHREDDEAIKHLLWVVKHEQQNHYRLTFPSTGDSPTNVTLHNLSTESESFGTTRIIRLYHRAGPHLELVQRIDWELPDDSQAELHPHAKVLNNLPNDFTHVIVLDLDKGVFNKPGLAQHLASEFKKAKWYIFSKSLSPKWLLNNQQLRNSVRLLFVPQTAATEALAGKESSAWITAAKGLPSKVALDFLQKRQSDYKKAHIVVMPHRLSLLLAFADEVYVQGENRLPDYGDLIPMATVMFPTLIAHDIALGGNGVAFSKLVTRSLAFTNHWMKSESHRFLSPEFKPKEEQVCRITLEQTSYCDGGQCSPVFPFRELQQHSLKERSNEWEAAFTGQGVVPSKSGARFQLWRAMTDVGGYVACVPQKRIVLQELLHITREFVKQQERRQTSVLLIDRPGSGKSFLVERLAKEVSKEVPVRRLEFNITQLLNRSDLVYCFDTIVTHQAQNPREPLLVFFDEINAKLDGNPVFDSFLAPLEQGIYVRSGNQFHIQPCLWVFAGSESPAEIAKREGPDRSVKISDFVSRLSYPPFELSCSANLGPGVHAEEQQKRIHALEKLERIYVAVANLRSLFGDVTQVCKGIFEIFEQFKEDMGPRAIRQFVRHFHDVQRGRVTIQNLPDRWWLQTDFTPEEAGEFVKKSESNMNSEFVLIES